MVAMTVALMTVTWCRCSCQRRDSSAGADTRGHGRWAAALPQPAATALHTMHSRTIRQMRASTPSRKAVSSERVDVTTRSKSTVQTVSTSTPSRRAAMRRAPCGPFARPGGAVPAGSTRVRVKEAPKVPTKATSAVPRTVRSVAFRRQRAEVPAGTTSIDTR